MWCRIGVGISANGMMAGPATAVSNAVICSPANGTVGQFDFLNATFEGIVPDNTAGTTNMSYLQSNNVTVLTWSRTVNNGNPTDAQISVTGPTYVVWAIGKSNSEFVVVWQYEDEECGVLVARMVGVGCAAH